MTLHGDINLLYPSFQNKCSYPYVRVTRSYFSRVDVIKRCGVFLFKNIYATKNVLVTNTTILT